MALDQGRLAAQAGGGDGADQAGRAGADDHQVVAPLGARVFVLRRVRVEDQLAVELVHRRHGDRPMGDVVCAGQRRGGWDLRFDRGHDE
jgi:hypothetical protein